MLFLLACAEPESDTKSTEDTADSTGDSADSTGDSGDPTGDDGDPTGATDGALTIAFSLDATVTGDKRLDSTTIEGSVGTLRLDGADHSAVAYLDHDWGAAGYHLYDLLSVSDSGDNLAVTYLYCDGNDVPYAYTESFVHTMDWETSEGDCSGTAGEITADVQLPALTAEPDPVDIGVVFEAGELAAGDITLDGTTRRFVPFNTVDCTDCPGGPWYELHSMLYGDADACFAILYLYPDDPTYVDAEYSLCLPTLTRPTGRVEGAWSGVIPQRPAPMARPRPPRRR